MSQLPASEETTDKPLDEAFGQLYSELQTIARRELGVRRRSTMHTTALVHEAYLRLEASAVRDMGRLAFLALAGKAMRCVLADHARANLAEKRNAGVRPVTLQTEPGIVQDAMSRIDVLALEQALQALGEVEPRLVTVVECRFHAGMEFNQIGEHLGVSERTAQRDWRRARVFLLDHMGIEA